MVFIDNGERLTHRRFRLAYGTDAEGNFCGVDNVLGPQDLMQPGNRTANYANLPVLYYFFPANSSSESASNMYSRCVSECPTTTDTSKLICRYEVTPATDNSEKLKQVSDGSCTVHIASQKSMMSFTIYRVFSVFTSANANSCENP